MHPSAPTRSAVTPPTVHTHSLTPSKDNRVSASRTSKPATQALIQPQVSQQSTLLARRHDLGHRMSGVSVQCRAQGGRAVVVKALSVLGEYVFLHRRPQQHICVSARRDLFRGSSLARSMYCRRPCRASLLRQMAAHKLSSPLYHRQPLWCDLDGHHTGVPR